MAALVQQPFRNPPEITLKGLRKILGYTPQISHSDGLLQIRCLQACTAPKYLCNATWRHITALLKNTAELQRLARISPILVFAGTQLESPSGAILHPCLCKEGCIWEIRYYSKKGLLQLPKPLTSAAFAYVQTGSVGKRSIQKFVE